MQHKTPFIFLKNLRRQNFAQTYYFSKNILKNHIKTNQLIDVSKRKVTSSIIQLWPAFSKKMKQEKFSYICTIRYDVYIAQFSDAWQDLINFFFIFQVSFFTKPFS